MHSPHAEYIDGTAPKVKRLKGAISGSLVSRNQSIGVKDPFHSPQFAQNPRGNALACGAGFRSDNDARSADNAPGRRLGPSVENPTESHTESYGVIAGALGSSDFFGKVLLIEPRLCTYPTTHDYDAATHLDHHPDGVIDHARLTGCLPSRVPTVARCHYYGL